MNTNSIRIQKAHRSLVILMMVLLVATMSVMGVVGNSRTANAGRLCTNEWNHFFRKDKSNISAEYYSGSFCIRSLSGRYHMIFQGDGNLVVYETGVRAKFSSKTYGHPNAKLYIQNDGNMVIYDNGRALWNSQTGTARGNYAGRALIMQDDGNFVMYKKLLNGPIPVVGETPLWSSDHGRTGNSAN